MASSGRSLVVGAFTVYTVLSLLNPVFVHPFSSKLSIAFSLLAVCISFKLWDLLVTPFYTSPLRHLPGPKDGALFNGQIYRLMREPAGMPQREWISMIPNDGLIRYLSLFNSEEILLTEPSTLQEVLVTKPYDFEKPSHVRDNMVRTIGNGLLLAEGEDHKYQRKHLQPAYKHRLIKNLYPIFWDHSCRLINAISSDLKGKNKDENGYARVALREKIHCAAMDTIGHAGMGIDFGALENPNCEVNQIYDQVVALGVTRHILAILAGVIPPAIVYSTLFPINRAINEVGSRFRELIRRSMETTKQPEATNTEDDGQNILMAAAEQKAFTDSGLESQAMTMIAAGIDATSAGISWGLLTLAQRPEILDRLQTEIRQNIPHPENVAISPDMIDSLPYLSAFCNEVTRFFPGVPVTARVAIRDTTVGGELVPKGTALAIVPAAINTDERFWGPDARSFNPDRFLKQGQGNSGGVTSSLANLTFLHGPHSCIGERYARSELACMFAALVGRFEMKMGPGEGMPKARPGINPSPEGNLELLLREKPDW